MIYIHFTNNIEFDKLTKYIKNISQRAFKKNSDKNNIGNFALFLADVRNKYENADWANCLKIINNCKNNINKNAYFALSAISLLFELNKTFSNNRFLINELESYQL